MNSVTTSDAEFDILPGDTARFKLPTLFPVETNSEDELVAYLRRLKRPIRDVSFKNGRARHSRACGIDLGQVVLHELELDPAVSTTLIDPNPSLIILLSGELEIFDGGDSWRVPPQTHITTISADRPMEFHSNNLHEIGFRPNLDDLNRAVASIIGDKGDVARFTSPHHTFIHRGQINGVNYVEQLLALVDVVNSTMGDLALLNRIGVADIFTRVLAEYCIKSVRGEPVRAPRHESTRSATAVDMICSHIEENIGKPLTIARMEQLTGMTGRALNYAFQKRFNCSPQQWQRRYLLDRARLRLLDRNDLSSVKAIAYDLGFTSSGSFTSHYSARFGERPSETRSFAQADPRQQATGMEGNS